MNLILLEPEEIAADGSAVLTDARALHIRKVLNAAKGQTLRIGLVDGPLGEATVASIKKDACHLSCRFSKDIPPPPRVDLLLALPRPKVMRRLWPVLASLGVGRIWITNAWKTERPYFDTHVLSPPFIREALKEGLAQARDTRLPDVRISRRFRRLVEDELPAPAPGELHCVAHPGPGAFPFPRVAAVPENGRVLLAIGPEGGWTPFELDLLQRRGFEPVSCGGRILRTDTACTVLLGLVHAALAADKKC